MFQTKSTCFYFLNSMSMHIVNIESENVEKLFSKKSTLLNSERCVIVLS